ncbi:MAG: hypothetical protein HUJ13_00250 [Hydrogenovibrio crunogenus]|nr:hypothetical protein [Hydrogenovibrio crunogenus]
MCDSKIWSKHTEFVREKYGIDSDYEIYWIGSTSEGVIDNSIDIELDVNDGLSCNEALEKHIKEYCAPVGWLFCGLFSFKKDSWIFTMIETKDYHQLCNEEVQ